MASSISSSVSLTDSAANRVREIMSANDGAVGVRVSVKPKGCLGLSYVLDIEYENGLESCIGSELCEDKGVKIYLDTKAKDFLQGTTIDFVDNGFHGGFVFSNPNAKNKCSCGSSFCV